MNLITRSDFDGLACAAILKEAGVIDSWTFVHPKDLQDGKIFVSGNDVLANVPYVEGCGLWFDHHSSEAERNSNIKFDGESRIAPSAAHIIYEYYGGEEKMPHFKEMIKYLDKVDSGDLTVRDVLNPKEWILLGFIMDPRTGLGRFRNYTISNYALMDKLIEMCRKKNIDDILKDSDVAERISMYENQNNFFKIMIFEHTKIYGNVILTDLRGVSPIYTGNRFLIYAAYAGQNISIWVVDGKGRQNVSIAVGHSIINRTSQTNVGSLMLKYGGGGHKQVGTCQIPYGDCDSVLKELISAMNADG